ncbi:MAG: hypothetical protein P1U56_25895, partial [Saprospiraceae bacterium]|nr:hypothetical protein [Saprospiraceae bacterium]
MSLGSRLKEFIDYQRITAKDFERKNNFTNGLISRIIRENGNMNSKHLQVIGENNPDLNMNWLLNGDGEMLLGNDQSSDEEASEKLREDIEFYKNMVKTLQKAVDAFSNK